MLIVAALVLILIVLFTMQVRFYLRRRRVNSKSWDELLAQLKPVNVAGVEEVAIRFLKPATLQFRLEPTAMWDCVGRWKGLNALSANADTILDLAAFAAQWNEHDGHVVAELIRRDGVRLKRAVFMIRLVMISHKHQVRAPFQIQNAAVAYHLMRGRLLGLYKPDAELYPRLAEFV